MFKNEYQGGVAVEILSASGKNHLGKLRSHHLSKEFDKDVKSNIYILEGSTTVAKLQFPLADSKQTLGLIQRFFVIQVFVPLSKDFAVELMVTNINNNKRRIMLSSSSKDITSTPLHAKLPLSLMKRDIWLNLCFDMKSLTNEMFSNQTFKAVEEFTISGTCKIKRIFSMKMQPPDTSDIPDDIAAEPRENIPMSLQFSNNVNFVTQVVTLKKVRRFLGLKETKSEIRETSGYWSSSSDDVSNARKLTARDQTQTRIAFGRKVAIESPRVGRQKGGPNSARSHRSQHLLSSNQAQTTITRNVQSSKARLPSQSVAKESSNLAVAPRERSSSLQHSKIAIGETKLRSSSVRAESKAEKPKAHSLISLIDDIDLTDSQEERLQSHRSNNDPVISNSASKLFGFTSQPHSLPRESGPGPLKMASGPDVLKASGDSHQHDERERIQQKIIRRTPTPRSAANSPKALRSMRDLKNSKSAKAMHPPSSMSPNLSLSHSSHVYDSSKYSDEYSARDNTTAANKSTLSLKSSDATLTESIDTLVQASFTADVSKDSLISDDSLASPEMSPNLLASRNVTVSYKNVREVPVKPSSQPESNGYQVGTWNESFEAQMLESMKRAVEEDMRDPDDDETSDDVDYQATFDDSMGASYSTYKQPPSMDPQAYDREMKEGYPATSNTLNGFSLSKSNPRDWSNLLSPPLVLPSVRTQQKLESLSDADSINNDYDAMALSDGSSCVSFKSSTTNGDTDEEEMLDLLYDPCLNCYFDPKSGKYYELKN